MVRAYTQPRTTTSSPIRTRAVLSSSKTAIANKVSKVIRPAGKKRMRSAKVKKKADRRKKAIGKSLSKTEKGLLLARLKSVTGNVNRVTATKKRVSVRNLGIKDENILKKK